MSFFPRFHFITSLNTHTSRLRRPGNWREQQPGCVLFVPHPCDWNWFLKIMPYRIRSNCCRIVICSVSNCDPGRWLSKCLALFLNGCFRLLWVCLRSPLQGYHPRYNLNLEDCFFDNSILSHLSERSVSPAQCTTGLVPFSEVALFKIQRMVNCTYVFFQMPNLLLSFDENGLIICLHVLLNGQIKPCLFMACGNAAWYTCTSRKN